MAFPRCVPVTERSYTIAMMVLAIVKYRVLWWMFTIACMPIPVSSHLIGGLYIPSEAIAIGNAVFPCKSSESFVHSAIPTVSIVTGLIAQSVHLHKEIELTVERRIAGDISESMLVGTAVILTPTTSVVDDEMDTSIITDTDRFHALTTTLSQQVPHKFFIYRQELSIETEGDTVGQIYDVPRDRSSRQTALLLCSVM